MRDQTIIVDQASRLREIALGKLQRANCDNAVPHFRDERQGGGRKECALHALHKFTGNAMDIHTTKLTLHLYNGVVLGQFIFNWCVNSRHAFCFIH